MFSGTIVIILSYWRNGLLLVCLRIVIEKNLVIIEAYINLLNLKGKVCDRIINNCLLKYLELNDNLHAQRAGRF